jgi:general secretion pathway protein A
MYQSHWGLREMPFHGLLDPEYFFPSPTHDEAIARLHFLVENHRRLGLVLGPVGCGKSLLFEVFARQLRRKGQAVAKLKLLSLDADEMLLHIAVEWGLNPPASASTMQLWRVLEDRLAEHRYRQIESVVLIDDAEEAGRNVLPHLTRLIEHDPSPNAGLTVLLAVEKSNVSYLGNRLMELTDLRIDIEPWTAEDVEGFLTSTLSKAGAKRTIFTSDACAKIHEIAGGSPRKVVQLADLAMVVGAGAELSEIDADVVLSVHHELSAVEVC